MTHTGAFCPSFDQDWTIKGDNRDLSDEDYMLLKSFNLFVKKSEPAEPTAKLDRMTPGTLKESSTLTGIGEHAQVLALALTGIGEHAQVLALVVYRRIKSR